METDYILKHTNLMKKWSEKELHKDKDFIADGIIDIPRWQKAKRKILFLLKEAYDGPYDLCDAIRDEWKGPKYKVWWTASYWLYALQKISNSNIPSFPKEQKQFDECVEYLLSSAVVNIKKSSGKTASDYEDVLKYAREDSRLLKEQISLINPDIILCGYTYDYFCEFWTDKITPVGDTEMVFKTGNHIVINYWHPANRQIPNELSFYALCAIIQNAKLF
jgi:hypothetical protein